MDSAFRRTCRLVLGAETGSLREAQRFLAKGLAHLAECRTLFGNRIYLPSEPLFGFERIPRDRLANEEEAEALSGVSVRAGDCASLDSLLRALPGVAFYRACLFGGNYGNNIETAIGWNSTDSYQVFDTTNCRFDAHCTMALDSNYCFGCYRVVHCDFCLRCHNCTKLSGCLEMDACSYCRNSMFCHNCENLEFCMFCSNAKNLKYAIANFEVGREKYMELRDMVLREITRAISEGGNLPIGIYDLCVLASGR